MLYEYGQTCRQSTAILVVGDLPLRGVRRFVLGDYLIHYEIGAGAIVILTIRHGRERPPELPRDDYEDHEAP